MCGTIRHDISQKIPTDCSCSKVCDECGDAFQKPSRLCRAGRELTGPTHLWLYIVCAILPIMQCVVFCVFTLGWVFMLSPRCPSSLPTACTEPDAFSLTQEWNIISRLASLAVRITLAAMKPCCTSTCDPFRQWLPRAQKSCSAHGEHVAMRTMPRQRGAAANAPLRPPTYHEIALCLTYI